MFFQKKHSLKCEIRNAFNLLGETKLNFYEINSEKQLNSSLIFLKNKRILQFPHAE